LANEQCNAIQMDILMALILAVATKKVMNLMIRRIRIFMTSIETQRRCQIGPDKPHAVPVALLRLLALLGAQARVIAPTRRFHMRVLLILLERSKVVTAVARKALNLHLLLQPTYYISYFTT
jgi:hypothetical protein